MTPLRIWLGFVALVWLAGFGVWAGAERPGLPAASVWLWLAAFGLACVPLVLALVDTLVDVVFRRRRDR